MRSNSCAWRSLRCDKHMTGSVSDLLSWLTWMNYLRYLVIWSQSTRSLGCTNANGKIQSLLQSKYVISTETEEDTKSNGHCCMVFSLGDHTGGCFRSLQAPILSNASRTSVGSWWRFKDFILWVLISYQANTRSQPNSYSCVSAFQPLISL